MTLIYIYIFVFCKHKKPAVWHLDVEQASKIITIHNTETVQIQSQKYYRQNTSKRIRKYYKLQTLVSGYTPVILEKLNKQ
jgi:hypothetical protein